MLGDAIEKLRELPSESVHCVVTSPPYWGLRDYSRCQCSIGSAKPASDSEPGKSANPGNSGSAPKKEPDPNCPICKGTGIIEGVAEHQLGLEKTPEEYVQHLVEVFREVKRVLRNDGTLWLNTGDSYASESKGTEGPSKKQFLKPKDLVGIPWRVAFALQADGWYLRSDIIWSKPNPMPESVRDRPTKSHEYIFLLTKSARYFWDQEAVRESYTTSDDTGRPISGFRVDDPLFGRHSAKGKDRAEFYKSTGRNIRSVWEITTQPYPDAHFATFPEELPRRCIKAGTSQKGCCKKCGAPWERIVVTNNPSKLAYDSDDRNVPEKGMGGNKQSSKSLHRTTGGVYPSAKVLGWQPTCECDGKLVKKQTWVDFGDGRNYKAFFDFVPNDGIPETIPCTVLDPFAGSGTTGWVARSLGRKAILIELNPVYGRLIADRTKSDIPDLTAFGQGGEVGA